VYEQIILCILTIGGTGFILDRLMSVIERRFKTA
jgi:nitrate/nitrite transport system permease protein